MNGSRPTRPGLVSAACTAAWAPVIVFFFLSTPDGLANDLFYLGLVWSPSQAQGTIFGNHAAMNVDSSIEVAAHKLAFAGGTTPEQIAQLPSVVSSLDQRQNAVVFMAGDGRAELVYQQRLEPIATLFEYSAHRGRELAFATRRKFRRAVADNDRSTLVCILNGVVEPGKHPLLATVQPEALSRPPWL